MQEVTMPKVSDTMDEGKILTWLKHEGDAVKRGEAIAEVETEKVTIEIECYQTGILRKILVQAARARPSARRSRWSARRASHCPPRWGSGACHRSQGRGNQRRAPANHGAGGPDRCGNSGHERACDRVAVGQARRGGTSGGSARGARDRAESPHHQG